MPIVASDPATTRVVVADAQDLRDLLADLPPGQRLVVWRDICGRVGCAVAQGLTDVDDVQVLLADGRFFPLAQFNAWPVQVCDHHSLTLTNPPLAAAPAAANDPTP